MIITGAFSWWCSVILYVRKGRKYCAAAVKDRSKKKKKKTKTKATLQIREERWVKGVRAVIIAQPVQKTMMKQAVPLQPVSKQISTLQLVENPTVQQLDMA